MTREEAIETLRANYPDKCYELLRNAVDIAIEALKTEQPHGHWIKDGHHIRCSECGVCFCDKDREGDAIPTYYCPNCGAEMRSE